MRRNLLALEDAIHAFECEVNKAQARRTTPPAAHADSLIPVDGEESEAF